MRGQKLTPNIAKNLKSFSSILNCKIPVTIDHSYCRTPIHILSSKTHALDKTLVLIEDYCLHSCFKEGKGKTRKWNGGSGIAKTE
jgi:hypothetical protein